MSPLSIKTLPKCLLITPARNEGWHLEKTILSMVAQTAHPTRWVIVNDGSTDESPSIIDRYASTHDWIERFDMPSHRDRSFAAKAHCFNKACETAGWLDYDVIGNIDADITVEPDFLEFLLQKFAEPHSRRRRHAVPGRRRLRLVKRWLRGRVPCVGPMPVVPPRVPRRGR